MLIMSILQSDFVFCVHDINLGSPMNWCTLVWLTCILWHLQETFTRNMLLIFIITLLWNQVTSSQDTFYDLTLKCLYDTLTKAMQIVAMMTDV